MSLTFKTKISKMKKVLIFLLSTVMSFVFAKAFSASSGIDPSITVPVTLSLTHGVLPVISMYMPNGIMSAVVLKRAYEAELLRSLKEIKDGFLARIPDRSELVGNDVLDITKAGVKPNVIIDNSSYPISASQRTDEGIVLALRKLTTEVTVVTEDELYALPYDKKNSVIEDHKTALNESYRKLALHSYCPSADSVTTPVLLTTGGDDGTGRKRLTKTDLVSFRTKLNNAGIGECDLVLCNEHVEDILNWSEVFSAQYQVIATGLVMPMFGFNISQNIGYAPVFNTLTKKAYGAVGAVGDVSASVAFIPTRMLKAYGSLKMYSKEPEPRYQQSEVNFNSYFIAVPKDSEGTGAIISGLV